MKRNHLFAALAAVFVGIAVVWAASGTIWTLTGKGSRRNTVEFEIVSPTVGSAANLVPGTTNTNALGTTALRFSNIYTELLNVSGLLSASFAVSTPAVFITPNLNVAVSTPSAVGQLGISSAGVVYVATSAVTINSWVKVGLQS